LYMEVVVELVENLVEVDRVGSNFVLWREFIYTVRNSSCVEKAIKSLLKRLEGLNCFSLGVILLFKSVALSTCCVVFVGTAKSELLKADSKKDLLEIVGNVSNPVNTRVKEKVAFAVLGKICIWPVVEVVKSDNVVKLLSVGSVGVMLGAIVLENCILEEAG
jgi:hypothetical protein